MAVSNVLCNAIRAINQVRGFRRKEIFHELKWVSNNQPLCVQPA